MKQSLPIILLLILSSTFAAAQGTTPKTRSGDKALLFAISGLGEFSISGSYVTSAPLFDLPIDSAAAGRIGQPLVGIGGKYFFSDRLALRAAVSFVSSTKTAPSRTDTIGEDRTSIVGFGISPALEFHLVTSGPVTVYAGAVASIGTITTTSTPSDVTTNASATSTTYGAGAILGAEFYPWENISLGAEYQFGIAVSNLTNERRGVEFDGPSYTTIGVGSFAATLGVHF